jgi:hypothetical protein
MVKVLNNTWIGSRNDVGKDYLKPINVEKKTNYGKRAQNP